MSAMPAPFPQPENPWEARTTIDFVPHVRRVWRRRFSVIAASAIGVVLAFGLLFISTPIYEAASLMRVIQEGNQTSIGDFASLLESNRLSVQVVEEFKLSQPPFNLTPIRFADEVLNIDQVRGSTLIRIRVRLQDPKLAMEVANGLARHGEQLANQLSDEQERLVLSELEGMRQVALRRADSAEEELVKFKMSSQIDLLRRDSEAELEQRSKILELMVSLEGERARLNRLETELAKSPQTFRLQRSFDDDAAMTEKAREAGRTGDALLGTSMQSEYANPVHQYLTQETASTRSRVANLESQYREVVVERKLSGPQLTRLNQLYSREIELGRLQHLASLSRETALELERRYQQSRLDLASRGRLQLVDQALQPERPVYPRPVMMIMAGLLIGFGLGLAGALLVPEKRA